MPSRQSTRSRAGTLYDAGQEALLAMRKAQREGDVGLRGSIHGPEAGTPTSAVTYHAWATYADLSACWKVTPETVRRWVSTFAREHPQQTFLSFRLRGGYRRERLVRSDTAGLIERLRIPLIPMGSLPTTVRTSGSRSRSATPAVSPGHCDRDRGGG